MQLKKLIAIISLVLFAAGSYWIKTNWHHKAATQMQQSIPETGKAGA